MFNVSRPSLSLALIAALIPSLSKDGWAQTYHDAGGTIPAAVVPLVGCSSGGNCAGPVSNANPMPVSGSFSATLSGFTPGGSYASPLSVSTTSARVALPTGSTVVVYNTGASTAYVILGSAGATATASDDVIPAGGWMAFTVGSNGYLAAITASGTTTLNVSGGSGLPTGAGGGGSGGGGGTVAQGTAAGAAGAWPAYLTLGGSAVGATNGIPITPATGASWAVTGTFWQATQPVSAAALPLPAGAATSALQTTLNTTLGSPFQAGGSIGNSSFGAASSPISTNPTSTLTLPATTTAYSAGQLIANNATAGSVTVPSFAIANAAGGGLIPRLRLSTNDSTSTAWGAVALQVDLWSAAPTWTNGDRGAWSPATGTGGHLGAYACTLSAEYGDGAYAECAPAVGTATLLKLASGTSVYWSLKAVGASGVTGASKVFTLTAEVLN